MSGQLTTVIGDQNIVGNNLFNVGNTTINNYNAERVRPLTLESCAVLGALLNSKERYPAPKCHPDTRQAALTVVKDWICRRGDESEKDIMWMSGAPGVGKSAIVQTAGETLGADDGSRSWFSRIIFGNGYIDACCFFARGCGDREKAASFPATIAYQLARSRPSFSWSIKNAIAANPSIFEESWPSQFRRLVLKPATERWSFLGPVTIVIDGLDECDSEVDQVQLLELVLEAAATKKMRFFIASRPDRAIETFFAQIHASQHTCHIRLDEETFHTRRDIEVFLRAKFARIRQLKPEGCPRLPNGEDWPGGVVIRQIADDSDSQFMFPELAVDFIDLPGFSPNEQLRILLSAPPPHAFSKLDALYDKILSYRPPSQLRREDNSPVDYRDTIMGILQITIAWPGGPFSPARIAELLDEKVDVVQSIIHGPMRSLFKGVSADPNLPVTLCHKSLRDYLLDRRRSKDFCISCGDAASFFTQILSRRPPTNPVQMYFPGAVMDVLTALLVKGGRSSMHEVADSLYLDYNYVERVVYGPARSLFDVTTEGIWFSTPDLQSFLMDPSQVADFYIPRKDRDAILLRVAIRQPLSSQPYSQDVWMDILAVVCVKPFPDLDISGIAFVLGIPPKVVEAAILGPTKSLFAIRASGKVRFSTRELPKFLSDPEWAGQLYNLQSKCDTFYASIISRPPPTDPSQAYSQDVLMGVLAVVSAWEYRLDVPQIATVLDVDSSVVDMMVSETHRLLFNIHHRRISFSSSEFGEFLSDRRRAGELCAPDAIFTRWLSCPPPSNPSQTYPRDVLMGVLAVIRDWGRGLTVSQVSRLLDVDPSMVNSVISGNPLFNDNYEISFSSPVFAGFLSNPERAGDYFVSNTMLDDIFTRILSRPPPYDPSQSYSREILVNVLAVVRHWGHYLTPSQIANILDVDPSMVNNVISGTSLFAKGHLGMISFLSTVFARFISDTERAGEYFVSNVMLDSIYNRIFSRYPMVSDTLYASSRQTLLDLLAVFNLIPGEIGVVRGRREVIASVLNLSTRDIEDVVLGPATAIFASLDRTDLIGISPQLKEFLGDVDRAGECYIPDEAKALAEAEYSHYTSIYEKARGVLEELTYQDSDVSWGSDADGDE